MSRGSAQVSPAPITGSSTAPDARRNHRAGGTNSAWRAPYPPALVSNRMVIRSAALPLKIECDPAGVDLPGLAWARAMVSPSTVSATSGLGPQSELVAAAGDAVDAVEMRRKPAAGRHQADPGVPEPAGIAMPGGEDRKNGIDQPPDFGQLGLEQPAIARAEQRNDRRVVGIDLKPVMRLRPQARRARERRRGPRQSSGTAPIIAPPPPRDAARPAPRPSRRAGARRA